MQSKDIYEQLDIFNDFFKEIIEESMYSKLKEACNVPDSEEIIVADIQFLPIFYKENGIKTLKRLMLKRGKDQKYQTILLEELEATGASWVEFIEYLKDCGAKVVNPRDLY